MNPCHICGFDLSSPQSECPNCGAVLTVKQIDQPPAHQVVVNKARTVLHSRWRSKRAEQLVTEKTLSHQLQTVTKSLDKGDFAGALKTYQGMHSPMAKLKNAKLFIGLLDLLTQSAEILLRQKEALAKAQRPQPMVQRPPEVSRPRPRSSVSRLALIPIFILAGIGMFGLVNGTVLGFETRSIPTKVTNTAIPSPKPTATIAPTQPPDPVPILTTNIDKIEDLFHWSAGQDIESLSFSPDGQFIVSGDSTESIQVWPLWREHAVYELRGSHAVFSPNGKWLGVAGSEGLTLYNASDGSLVFSLDKNQSYHSILFSPDSQLIVGGADSGNFYIWSVNDGAKQESGGGFHGSIHSLSFSQDGVFLAVASNDKTYVWNLQEQKIERSVDIRKQSPVYYSLAIDLDGVWLATGQENGQMYIWRISNGERMAIFDDGSQFVHGLQFFHSTSSPEILVSGDEVNLSFWIMQEYDTRLYRSIYSSTPILSLDIAPHNKLIATGGKDGVIHLWGVMP